MKKNWQQIKLIRNKVIQLLLITRDSQTKYMTILMHVSKDKFIMIHKSRK